MFTKYLAFVLFFGLFTTNVLGQSENLVYRTDLNSFIDQPSYTKKDGQKYNSTEFYTHPDFGKLTFTAPLDKRVVEDLSKRKIDERYYIDLDDPNFFYIEKSSSPINFMKDGYLRAIDFSLKPNGSGNYISNTQPAPTGINTNLKSTHIEIENALIRFNNYSLQKINNDNSSVIEEANWSNVHMTNFEAYVSDIFFGIDLQIKFFQGKIKSNFIIKQNLNVKELHFIDNVQLPVGFNWLISDTNPFNQEFVEIYNETSGITEIVVAPARTFDASENHESWVSTFTLAGNNLIITCDSVHLNDPSKIYPITVDPTFTAVGPITNGGGVMGSQLTPALCTNNLVVNFPGGATPWDTQATWTILSDFCAQIYVDFGAFVDCWNSEAQVRVTSSCGGVSPTAGVWTCPGCNTIGYWTPTLGFNQSGTQSLAQCYTPSCANQNLTFTISLNRTFCNSAYGYDLCVWANSYCQSLDTWSVTVQGRSIETLGNTATGNGTQNIYDADCAGTQNLNPTPLYGVGGYTYAWSHGPSTPSVNVPGTVSTYTCVVTDACGTAVTATFDIGCPLSVDLKDFSGLKLKDKIQLNLELGNEEGISTIKFEKSIDGTNWSEFERLVPKGVNKYIAYDTRPENGTNLYRIKFDKTDGTVASSEIISIDFEYAFNIYPNPASDVLNVKTETKIEPNTFVSIQDLMGREIIRTALTNQLGSIDISGLKAGNYLMLISEEGEIIQAERLSVIR